MERTSESTRPPSSRMLATIVRQFEPSRLERQTLTRAFELVWSPREGRINFRPLSDDEAIRNGSVARVDVKGGK